MKSRFQDDLRLIDSFGDEFLVHCPQCERCAKVLGISKEVRFVCAHCGKYEKWKSTPGMLYSQRLPKTGQQIAWIGAEYDWYFHYPLWLQTPCCGKVLWVYNAEHLSYLENYVAAGVRERKPNNYGWRNASYISRLPQWLKSAKNRAAILQSFKKLKALLENTESHSSK